MTQSRRCLILSNLYPPHHIGGYELGCRDLAEALVGLGWDVSVLTGDHRRPEVPARDDDPVDRSLCWLWDRPQEMSAGRRAGLVARDLRALRRHLHSFRPDHVLVFNTLGLHKALLAELAGRNLPFTVLVSDLNLPAGLRQDRWFEFWLSRPRNPVKRALKAALRGVARAAGLHPSPPETGALVPSAVFTSEFLRRQHQAEQVCPPRSAVLRWGVDASRITPRPSGRSPAGRFVFAGQLRDDKGPQTAIAAAAHLRRLGCLDFTLDLYGSAMDPAYRAALQARIDEGDLARHVFLRGEVPRERLASLYAEYDVLLFPSIWEEPFSIGLLEGMAAGLAVIATPTGGTPEILADGENALLFPAGDAALLAEHMAALLTQPARVRELGLAARRTVREGFTLSRMAESLSLHLGGQGATAA